MRKRRVRLAWPSSQTPLAASSARSRVDSGDGGAGGEWAAVLLHVGGENIPGIHFEAPARCVLNGPPDKVTQETQLYVHGTGSG